MIRYGDDNVSVGLILMGRSFTNVYYKLNDRQFLWKELSNRLTLKGSNFSCTRGIKTELDCDHERKPYFH